MLNSRKGLDIFATQQNLILKGLKLEGLDESALNLLKALT